MYSLYCTARVCGAVKPCCCATITESDHSAVRKSIVCIVPRSDGKHLTVIGPQTNNEMCMNAVWCAVTSSRAWTAPAGVIACVGAATGITHECRRCGCAAPASWRAWWSAVRPGPGIWQQMSPVLLPNPISSSRSKTMGNAVESRHGQKLTTGRSAVTDTSVCG